MEEKIENQTETVEPVLYSPVFDAQENDGEEIVKKKSWYKKLGPLFAGIVSFLFGMLYFLPLDSIAEQGLNNINKTGTDISVSNIALTLGGNFNIENIEIPLDKGASEDINEIKVKDISGDISVLKFLFSDKLSLEAQINGLIFQMASLIIKGGAWDIESMLENVTKKQDLWLGEIRLNGSQVQASYKELPMIGKEFETLFDKVYLDGILKDNIFQIKKALIEGADAKINITGNIKFTSQGAVNCMVTIMPAPALFERYKEDGIKELIQAMGYLQPDGSIQITLTGTLKNPRPMLKRSSGARQGPMSNPMDENSEMSRPRPPLGARTPSMQNVNPAQDNLRQQREKIKSQIEERNSDNTDENSSMDNNSSDVNSSSSDINSSPDNSSQAENSSNGTSPERKKRSWVPSLNDIKDKAKPGSKYW
ncbi:MAG: hypothetical protein OEZ22_08900 [Spirochaetia bacterium]|nr:hypothetical protein [Spirochaetia bacterium]